MKHIILLDRDGEILNYIIQKTEIVIVALVTEKTKEILQLIQNTDRILNTVDYNNLLETQSTDNIDYDIIELMKKYQIDIETMLHRVMLNNPIAKDIYYQHLSFFLKLFQTHSLDCILCSEFNLSAPSHLIPFGLGKLFKIPTYSLEGLPAYPAISALNFNTLNRIQFPKNGHDKILPEHLMYYKHSSQQVSTKKSLKKRLEKCFGYMFIEFISCILRGSIKRRYLGIKYSYFSKLISLFRINSIKNFYNNISIIPNYSEKYIYYSLHMEPEATIIGKTLLESQLTIIKMLARSLPKGWKLYVKEHPHQFMLNTEYTNYFLHNIVFFKNKEFYAQIANLPNTFLIPLDIHPSVLIKNSQAVATIAGTVTLEALFQNKYTLLFSADTSLFGKLENVLSIKNTSSILEALKIIEANQNKHFDTNRNFLSLRSVLLDTTNSDFYTILFRSIEQHMSNLIRDNGQCN